MRQAALAFTCLLLAVWAGAAEAHGAHSRTHGRAPVVVELFTSQGCSSCVAADKLLGQLADRPGVLALTFPVDYWDYLGWSDTFAKPEFSDRQKAYMQKLALRDLYTPQVIIDGRGQVAGSEPKKIDLMIRQAQRDKAAPPRLRFLHRGRVEVGRGRRPPGGADLWLVRYDPAVREVVVKRGENRGQTIPQRNVVRDLVRLGAWSGKARSYPLPAAAADEADLKTGVLLQAAKGGRILAVLQR